MALECLNFFILDVIVIVSFIITPKKVTRIIYMNFSNEWFQTKHQSKLSALYRCDLSPVKDSNGFRTHLFSLKLLSRSDVKVGLKA